MSTVPTPQHSPHQAARLAQDPLSRMALWAFMLGATTFAVSAVVVLVLAVTGSPAWALTALLTAAVVLMGKALSAAGGERGPRRDAALARQRRSCA